MFSFRDRDGFCAERIFSVPSTLMFQWLVIFVWLMMMLAMTYQQDRRYYFKKSKVVRVKSFLYTSLAQRLPRVDLMITVKNSPFV